ncbi:MMPL family transporter [Actinomadura fulvescens]|uniref:Membrane transport protein MMPL domain-containing protein n=1 Tax=Actinomadura fulvescens TaxID=46160 RepID=A0ABN3QW41_9ACTN
MSAIARHKVAILIVTATAALVSVPMAMDLDRHVGGADLTVPNSPSDRADRMLADRFGGGHPDLVLVATAPGSVDDRAAAAAGRALTRRLAARPDVRWTISHWQRTAPPGLRSADRRRALLLVRLAGGAERQQRHTTAVVSAARGRHGVLDVAVTGAAELNAEATRQGLADLRRGELIAAPIILACLVLAFGGVTAALLPLLVAGLSIAATFPVLRMVSALTEVSVFALNMATVLGMGLAIDYSLLIITRFRQELAAGKAVGDAVSATVRTAGRTVVVSGVIVMVSLAAALIFPIYPMRSLAYAGIPIVGFTVLAAVVTLPAVLALTGSRIDRFSVRAPWLRLGTPPIAGPPYRRGSRLWGLWGLWAPRLTRGRTRRPGPVAVSSSMVTVPAVLAVFGGRMDKFPVWPPRPRSGMGWGGNAPYRRGLWGRVAHGVARRPTPVVLSSSMVALPALLLLFGRRLDGSAVRPPRPRPGTPSIRHPAHDRRAGPWGRLALAVMRRPVSVALGTAAVLVLLGSPFAGARFGIPDDRALPAHTPVRITTQLVRDQFAGAATVTSVVLPGSRLSSAKSLDGYARALSRLSGVSRVDAATGTYRAGRRVAEPGPASRAFRSPSGTWLSVASPIEPVSAAGADLVRRIRAVPSPGPALVGGIAAGSVDLIEAVRARVAWVIAIMGAASLLLVAAFTRSLLLPVKTVVLNVLSLTASFGAMVYVFQDGHLRELLGDFTPTGTIDVMLTVLVLCIAYGLSMDYALFLLSGIKERYDVSGDNTAAVAQGLQQTGRLVTAAAVLMVVVLAAFTMSGLTPLKMFGVGLGLAVLVDATLVRCLLVPALMRLAGRANWWFPGRVRRR